MKTRDEFEKEGWTNIEYDDGPADVLEKINRMLGTLGLSLEEGRDHDEPCDGFKPMRIVALEASG